MGDVPVLMGSATAGAIIIPLGVVLPTLGTGLAIGVWVTVATGAFIVSRRKPGLEVQSVSKKTETGPPTAA